MESMISKLWNQLIALGAFSIPRLPFVSKNKQFVMFFWQQSRMLSIYKNDGDLTNAVPGMLSGGHGFTRIVHLRGESVVWSSNEYDNAWLEGLLNELLVDLILVSECNLGRGLTDEAAAELFREQNPHMLSEGAPGYRGPVGALGVLGLPKLTDEEYIRGLEQRLRLTFKGDKEYADYLQRLIQLQEMSPGGFMEDSQRSVTDLELMYPHREVLLNVPGRYLTRHIDPSEMDPLLRPDVALDKLVMGNTMKSTLEEHYIPQPDEPSPFRYGVDWVNWRRKQPANPDPSVSYMQMLKDLLERLRSEKPRTLAQRDHDVPPNLTTADGHLSLGYVIHIRYSANVGWEQAHSYGLQQILKYQS